jgi:hypothetical protein
VNRFESAILFLTCAAVIALAVPGPAYAAIEVDEEEVIFRFEHPGEAKVFLAGDFNNWNPTMDGMVKRGGAWEVRLYLVPGKYRYMFVVDGENIPDPDNPNRDADGNTFFIFVEEDGVYKIIYEVTAAGKRKIDEIYTPYGALTAAAVEDYGLFTASAGVDGEIDGSIRGNILIGAEYETTAEDPIKAYLVRAKGEWVTEKFRLGAFHRSGRVGFDDPLSLFTDVGPYAYPLDLFCRGAEVSAGWKNSVEGRVFFANRIDGYSSGLENAYYLEFDGNPEDKDMIGASLKGSLKPVVVEYMYRHDRGPGERYWWSDGYHFMDGYHERTSHGLLLEFEKKNWPKLRTQYLTGQTSLKARADHDYYLPESNIRSVDYKNEWEEGYKALAEVSWLKGPFLGLLGWNRTTIERNPELMGPHDWDDARMDIFDASVNYMTGRMKIDLKVDLVEFSGEGGMGRNFWLQGSNFWLDGDMLRTELIQFGDSKRMWRVALGIEEEGVETIPGPYRLEGYLSAKGNWDGDEARSMFEISGGKGIRAGSFLSLHADLRFVSYSDDRWVGDSSFLDFWAGLRGTLGGSGWAALGVGVAPHRFDRWYFDFTGDGRESYLLDQDLFQWVTPYGEDYLLEELGRAEKSLSEEWRLSFEAGFSF